MFDVIGIYKIFMSINTKPIDAHSKGVKILSIPPKFHRIFILDISDL